MTSGEKLMIWDDARLVEEILGTARIDAFVWDLATDHIERRGAVEQVFGLGQRELGTTGGEYFRLVHPADRQRLRDAIESLTPAQPLLVHDYRMMLPSGEIRWYQEQARGEFSSDGRLALLRGLTIDITGRAEAEERVALLARISEMISASTDPSALLYDVSCAVGEHLHARRCLFTEIDLDDDRGVVRRDYCRGVPSVAGVYRISDYSERTRGEMLAGRTVINTDSKLDPRTAAAYERTYAPNGERAYIAVPLLRNGKWVAELWISDDVPRPWSLQDVALIESVAERAWTAVEKLRIEREREELLARERKLRAQADEASIAKDHFLALLSHELRTPMTTVLGWAAFLESGMADAESVARAITSIAAASRTQARLIDDLLDVSRIVTGKLALDSVVFDVRDAVSRAIEITHAAAAPGIRFIANLGDAPALVRGDATRMQQVVWNLLSNALKFTDAGGEISVGVRRDARNVTIVVKDSGCGIDPAFLPHVFERFRQAEDGPSRRFGGLGLGLSIVRHVAELHGGSVMASSAGPGCGAEFTVTIPASETESDVTPAYLHIAPPRRDALNGVDVLVIDHDDASRNVIAMMLSGFGARVRSAASDDEALSEATRATPSVIVRDFALARDGRVLLRRLRERDERIRAVAVTAFEDSHERNGALGAGFEAWVAKPVEPVELAAAVLRALGQ